MYEGEGTNEEKPERVNRQYVQPLMPFDSRMALTEWASPKDIDASTLIAFCAFHNFLDLSQKNSEYTDHHGKAELVEAAIQKYFDVPTEYLRISKEYNYVDEFGVLYKDEYFIETVGGGGA